MVFAPAVAIACCQVLAALCGLIAGLFAILGLKQLFLPGDGPQAEQAFLVAAIFVAGALVCLWFVRLVQRLARGE